MGANGIKQFYANPMTDGLTPKQRVFQLINGENKNGKFGMNSSLQRDPKTGKRFGLNENGEPMTLQEQLNAMTNVRQEVSLGMSNGFQLGHGANNSNV